MSAALLGRKNLPGSEAICRRAIAIAEDARQQNSQVMGALLVHLANVHIAYNEYEDAEACLKQALAIFERELPAWDSALVRARERHESVLRSLGQADEPKATEAKLNPGGRQSRGQ